MLLFFNAMWLTRLELYDNRMILDSVTPMDFVVFVGYFVPNKGKLCRLLKDALLERKLPSSCLEKKPAELLSSPLTCWSRMG